MEAAQNGLEQLTKSFPKVNIPNAEPLKVTELKIGAGSKGVVALDQNFKDCDVFGFPTSKLTKFAFNSATKTLEIALEAPELKKVCQYNFNGKVLLLPIVGDGRSTVALSK